MQFGLFWRDVVCSVRVLWRHRTLNFGLVATVGLVVGLITLILTLFYGVFFRQLPFPNSERMVMLWEANRETGQSHLPVSEGAYPLYRSRLVKNFQGIAAFTPVLPSLPRATIRDTGEQINEIFATPEIFNIIPCSPERGRIFSESDDDAGAPRVAILSYRMWKRSFSGREVLGSSITLKELGAPVQYTIVGIMPERYEFPYPLMPERPDIWVVLPQVKHRFTGGHNFYVVGRLIAGGAIGAAQAELNQVGTQIAVEQPRIYGPISAIAVPLYTESIRDSGAVVAVLIACLITIALIGSANISHLVMARVGGRRKEIAVRLALGACRRDIFRLAAVELGVLLAIGGGLGLIIASWGVATLPAILPPELYIPRAESMGQGAMPLLCVLFLCSVACVTLALSLSKRVSERNLAANVKTQVTPPRSRHGIFRRSGTLLLTCEVALAFALVSAALVLSENLGAFKDSAGARSPDQMLSAEILFPNSVRPGSPPATSAAFDLLLLNASKMKGVKLVSVVESYPLTDHPLVVELGTARIGAELHRVSPGFAGIAGLELKQGRWLNDSDNLSTTPVAVINEAMARSYFPGAAKALGAVIRTGRLSEGWPEEWTVQGIVREPPRFGTGRPAGPAIYVPFSQAPSRNVSILVRSNVKARLIAKPIKEEILTTLAHGAEVAKIQTGADIIANATARSTLLSQQMSALSAIAILLAGIGIYCVVSFHSARRKHEIAIRMAVGSSKAGVLGLVLNETLRLVSLGSAAGIVLSLALAQLLTPFRAGRGGPTFDAYFLSGVILWSLGIVACLPAARAAASVDPMESLRND